MISARKIGLTGGIGSGKSVVSGMLMERGLRVVDADQITRMVHRDPDVCHQLVTVFGVDVVDGLDDEHLSVNRKVLAQKAFSSAERLKKLNDIMHPALLDAAERMIHGESGRIVLDAALLFEAGWDSLVEKTVTVLSPLDDRVKRVQARDGLSIDQINARIRAQMSDVERVMRSDYLIYNVGSMEMLKVQVRHLFWNR